MSNLSVNSIEDKKLIKLQSKDGEIYPIELNAAKKSNVIARLLEDLGYDSEKNEAFEPIPLPNVASSELKKIVDFLAHHANDTTTHDAYHAILVKNELSHFDRDFLPSDKQLLLNLFMAANYLDIDFLKEICGWSIANTIKSNSPAAINEIWNYENDHSPEELLKLKEGYAWTEKNN